MDSDNGTSMSTVGEDDVEDDEEEYDPSIYDDPTERRELNDGSTSTKDSYMHPTRDDVSEDGARGVGIDRTTSKQKSLINTGVQPDGDKFKELYAKVIVEKGPYCLGIVDAIHLAIVLESLGDQMDIIGQSIDAPQVDLRRKDSVDLDHAIHRPYLAIPPEINPFSSSIFREKYILRQYYETVAGRRLEQMVKSDTMPFHRPRLGTVLRQYGVSKFSEKGKIQAERTQIHLILDNLVAELVQDCSLYTLKVALDGERQKYKGMKEKIQKSTIDQQRIRDTKKAIATTKVDKAVALEEMRDFLWNTEDETQEMVRRKALETLYVQHNGVMVRTRMKKICSKSEKKKKVELEDFKLKVKIYHLAHASMMDIIENKYNQAKRRLEHWVDKYETDKEALQSDLDTLKANRARDLERIEWLKKYIKDYGEIVTDDRRIKGIVQERERFHVVKVKKATKIQAWWRGEMVRKRLGPYAPPKPNKPKKSAK